MSEKRKIDIDTIINKMVSSKYELIQLIENPRKNGSNVLITYLNQHAFNVCWERENYRKLLLKRFVTYNDGIGMFLASIILHRKYERIDATDFNTEIFAKLINNSKYRIAIVGGSEKLELKLSRNMKAGNVLFYKNGIVNDSFFLDLMDSIDCYKPNTIFIGLGIPLQEEIASQIADRYHNCVIICVGNFLEFYFTTISRAPKILRQVGFEWLYRLRTEPSRLWRRYLLGIPLFIYRIFLLSIWSLRK